MKRLLTSLCALCFLSVAAFGANPAYEAFLGTNGIIIISNPPSGKIIVDGRLLTNGLTFGGLTTNANQFLGVPLSIKNGALFTNIVDIGTFWVTNNATVLFGTPGEGGIFTNNLTQFQRNNWLMSDAGKVFAVQSNTSILLQHGAAMAIGGSSQTAPTIVFIGTNAQIRTVGGSNYTFIGDMVTADPKTHIVRFLELSNYVSAVGGGGSLTTNANQFLGVPLSIKDAALFTNTVNFGAGLLGAVTNILTAPQFLGTNVVFDGSLSSWFQFNPRTGPETNYVFTNIQAGQTIRLSTFVTNGTTVRLWANTTEIPAAWYVGNNGSAANINSNAPSVVYVSRDPLVPATNVTIWTRDFDVVAGSGIIFTTNFPAGTVSMAAGGGGGDSVWTNENGNIHLIESGYEQLFELTNNYVSGMANKWRFQNAGGNEWLTYTNPGVPTMHVGVQIGGNSGSHVFLDGGGNMYGEDNVFNLFWMIEDGGNAMFGADKFVINDSGDLTKINNVSYNWPSAQGAAGTVLTNDGTGVLGWGTGGGGVPSLTGTTNFFNLSVQAAKLPATNYASIDAGWTAWETLYYETNDVGARVNLSAAWQFMVPQDYATNSLQLLINYSITSTNGPNTSNVIFGASFLVGRSGTTNNIRTNTFGFTAWVTNDWIAKYDGTNYVTNAVINLGTNAAIKASDLAVMKLERDVANDTYGGAVAVHGLQIQYTRP